MSKLKTDRAYEIIVSGPQDSHVGQVVALLSDQGVVLMKPKHEYEPDVLDCLTILPMIDWSDDNPLYIGHNKYIKHQAVHMLVRHPDDE